MTLFMTSVSHDIQRLVTSLDRDVMTQLSRDADDVIIEVERSLLSNASQQRDIWRHDVTACHRHVSQLTAHVSQLTSGDTWQRLDTNQLPGSPLYLSYILINHCIWSIALKYRFIIKSVLYPVVFSGVHFTKNLMICLKIVLMCLKFILQH